MKAIPYIDDMEKWRKSFSFSTPIKIRFSETDMFGHVNNVSPFIYFEQARIEFLKSVGLFNSHSKEDNGIPVVADLQCNYLQQMYFNEDLTMYVKANHIGNTSIDIHYMGIVNEEIALTGRGRLVHVHPKTGRPLSISEDMKENLLKK
ncbi:acyl-CoA thioesterase [Oceanobacillus manasiensis]|uniref:acyl-CoA thioesterase n=1 Tax=Oceanobacillus manasiensis TaxID=586413 RepID=UPI0005AAE67E|nr:thioesterase family protein [Oceanobacillus manasiensis]